MKNLVSLAVAFVLFSTMGYAQGLGLKGVGGSVGFTSVSATTSSAGSSSTSETLSGFVIGGHVDLGEFSPGFQLIPELQYWSVSKDINSVNWKFSDFAINGNVHYNFAMQGSVKPYVGAGIGVNFWSSTVDVPASVIFGVPYGGGSFTDSGSRFGLNIMGGANFAAGNLTIFPELRYVLASDINHLIVKVGVTFPLGR
jgi:opacity protein-like surface antigen